MTHHLACGHAARLDRELAAAHVKQVLERGAEEVDDEDIVQPFLAKVVDLGDTGCDGSVHAWSQEGAAVRQPSHHVRDPLRIL